MKSNRFPAIYFSNVLNVYFDVMKSKWYKEPKNLSEINPLTLINYNTKKEKTKLQYNRPPYAIP